MFMDEGWCEEKIEIVIKYKIVITALSGRN